MRKFRLYYDKDKEEIWLNQMCSKGWGMTRFFMGVYTFEPCIPDEYTYQVDLPDLWGHLQMTRIEKSGSILNLSRRQEQSMCVPGDFI